MNLYVRGRFSCFRPATFTNQNLKMKHFLLLTLAFALHLACSNSKKGSTATASPAPPSAQTGNPETSATAQKTSGEFHYAVQFKFTQKSITPLSATRQDDKMDLIVAPANEMFLVAYSGETLVHFYRFADPMQVRAAGGESPIKSVPEATATLLFPSEFADAKHSSQIGIYIPTTYVPNFKASVSSATALRNAVRDGKFEDLYRLEPAALSAFLQKI